VGDQLVEAVGEAAVPVLQQHIELILPVGLVDQVVAGVVE